METLDIDPNFEPQTRARSNTWPLPRPDNFIDHDGDDKSGIVTVHLHGQAQGDLPGQIPKKNSSRRNAWGNMSYADLITQAIQSSPEKRLTLAQIYEWMVQNVPYFKDKGDSNSSAGWKNSIRHNLSLHNRFMRVQNEGTGKSSWWMINPDAKPGKAARRRATSMETQKYEKKRGRVKKKVEALRNGQDTTPSPSSSISEGLDMFPESPVHHGFQLSPDFRPRASSNASSCGRLSPIPAVESDMHDNEVPPLSPIPWNTELARMYGVGGPTAQSSQGGNPSGGSSSATPLDRFTTDQLVDTLADSMKLGNSSGESGYLVDCAMKSSPNSGQMNSSSYTLNYTPHYGSGGGVSRGNGDYRSPYQSPVTDNGTLPPLGPIPQQQRSPQQVIETGLNGSSYTLTKLQTISPAAHNSHAHSISPTNNLEPMPQSSAYNAQRPTPPPSFCSSIVQDSLLRAQVVHKESRASPLVRPSPPPPPPPPPPSSHHHQSSTSLSSTASQVMGHLLSLNNTLPQDLDFDSIHGGLECDVEQVIRHELSVDGNLDFNFDPMNAMSASSGSTVPHPATMTTTRSWVH